MVSNNFSVSVVIPTYNAGDDLRLLLDKLLVQDYPIDKVFIIDSSSSDSTSIVASSYNEIELITIPKCKFNHGRTRHMGFNLCDSDIVVFLTQDAIPVDNQLIKKLVSPFKDDNIALSYGRQLPKDNARPFEVLVRNYSYPSLSETRSLEDVARLGIKAYRSSDVCAAYRSEAYYKCGGFIKCETNEDMFMAAQFINTGYAVSYTADAVVYHSHNLTLKQQYRRNYYIGRELEKNKELLCGASDISEGKKIFKYVVSGLLNERNFSEVFSFFCDCSARYIGNKIGRNSVKK